MVELSWSPKMAYAIGLLATDGYLSVDGRHFDLTSKDIEQLENFRGCLGLKVKIGWKNSGFSGKCPHIQFGDVRFYKWLLEIGFVQQKTKNIGRLTIPKEFFFDFLRGHFDGDGSTYAYFDPRWKSSYMVYLTFLSASLPHLYWLKDTIKKYSGFDGRVGGSTRVNQLRYAKYASLGLYKQMYYDKNVVCLSRKKKKFEEFVKRAEVEKLVNSQP